MSTEDILNYYEEVKDDLKFQNTSSVRTKIMINLMEGSKKTKDLRKSIGIQSSTILHSITELEKQNLISRKGDNYSLSETGKIMILKSIDTIKTAVSLKKFQKLLIDHEINSIPPELLIKIGDLSNSELIEAESDDMFKTHGMHAQIVLNATEVKGVSPIFYPDYIETFNRILENGTHVELILTEEVLKKTIESHDLENLENTKRFISQGTLKIWELKEDAKAAFTVTDKSITLGLFSKKGMYDPSRILVSSDDDAIEWCNKLFEYYKKRAKKVNLECF